MRTAPRILLPSLLAVLPALLLAGCASAPPRAELYPDYPSRKAGLTSAVTAMDVFIPDYEEGLKNDSASYRVDIARNRDILDKCWKALLDGLSARGYRIAGDSSYQSVGLAVNDGPYRVAADEGDLRVSREVLPLANPPLHLGETIALDYDKRKTLQFLYWDLPTYMRTAKEQGKPAELAPLLGTGRLGEVLALASFRGADNLAAHKGRPVEGGLRPWISLDLVLVDLQSRQVVWAGRQRSEPSRVGPEEALALLNRALRELP
jgi:hypothetical protein